MKTDKQAKPLPRSKRILNIAVNVLLVAVVIFGIFCSYTAFASKNGNGVPNFFGIQAFSIQSHSMEPEFYQGDLIIDTSVKDTSKLKVGDVITFYTIIDSKRALNTHRIIEIIDGSPTYYVTKGDNNTLEDTMRVHQNEIVGKYAFRIPALGNVIDFLQTSTGFLLVIVLPVFLFFIYNLVQFFRVFFDYRMKAMRMQLEKEMSERQGMGAAPIQESIPVQPEAKPEVKPEVKPDAEDEVKLDVSEVEDEVKLDTAQTEEKDDIE